VDAGSNSADWLANVDKPLLARETGATGHFEEFVEILNNSATGAVKNEDGGRTLAPGGRGTSSRWDSLQGLGAEHRRWKAKRHSQQRVHGRRAPHRA
jgi:hypothetical protein